MSSVMQGKRGSIAVEAALVVPVVIVAVFVVIYIMLLIFQTALMQVTADNIVERAAIAYYNNNIDFDSGQTSKNNIAGLDIYRRWSKNASTQQNDFTAAALKALNQKSILKGQSSLDIQKNGNIINQRITVVLKSNYNNPIGAWTSIFGLNNKISLSVYSEAAIDDPAEFIRNSDFILETAAKIPVIRDFQGKWQEIVNKIIDYINKTMKE